jgi:hypothetical protein
LIALRRWITFPDRDGFLCGPSTSITPPARTIGGALGHGDIGEPRSSDTLQPKAGKKSAVVPRPDRVVLVILENEQCSSITGSAQAPYLNELVARGANLTHSHGVTHPSQPNYLALFSQLCDIVSAD